MAGKLDYHVTPFVGAFEANVAGVMPTYSTLEGATLNGRPIEQVGAGFNKQLLTDILRDDTASGVILTDWAVTNDCNETCQQRRAGRRASVVRGRRHAVGRRVSAEADGS